MLAEAISRCLGRTGLMLALKGAVAAFRFDCQCSKGERLEHHTLLKALAAKPLPKGILPARARLAMPDGRRPIHLCR